MNVAVRGKLVLQAAVVTLVALLIALLGWQVASRNKGQNVASQVEKGKSPAAPDVELPRLNGSGAVSLASFRGKAVVLNFWASWCIPCRDEAPRLQGVWEQYGGQDVVVLGIDAQDFTGDARRFIERFGVTGFPETWFVSRDGRLVGERVQGPVSEEQLERNIQLALGSEPLE